MSTSLRMTPAAVERIRTLMEEEGKTSGGLRVYVQGGGCSGFQYGMQLEEQPAESDNTSSIDGVSLFVDPVSFSYLQGAEVDFVDSITGGGFTIMNPNVKSTCGCGESFST